MCENTAFPARDTTNALKSKEKTNNLDTSKTAMHTEKCKYNLHGDVIATLLE